MRHTVHQIVAQLTAHTAHIRDEIGVDEHTLQTTQSSALRFSLSEMFRLLSILINPINICLA